MLQLVNIKKDYKTESIVVNALKGVSIAFRKNEFVSILGPSGCGKTTLLNIVGGLDRYTSGDLIINGKSTKLFNDKDWDSYRNHSIGFVFQNYNLIPHQTILENVEIALTLSGVSKKERKEKAIEVLSKVGLSDKINVKPNQLSGGQMQRVAIARALVNNPDILLADEPTGALDTKTSVQILDLLKEIAKEKLVIMVTHNPELAESYSTRIIKLLDGEIVDDSNPYSNEEENRTQVVKNKTKKKIKEPRTSMSFFTALQLSLKNLLTKMTRTILISFAGSIGIIGIALILSLSSGFQNYIDKVQEDTLSTYPIALTETSVDATAILEEMMGKVKDKEERELDKVYSNAIMIDMFKTFMAGQHNNNLKLFKEHIESDEEFSSYISAIKYSYHLNMQIYLKDTSNGIIQVNPTTLFNNFMGDGANGLSVFSEIIDNPSLIDSQYDVIYGRLPSKADEIVLVVNENNEINDYILYALGIKDPKELDKIMKDLMNGKEVDIEQTTYSYEEIVDNTYTIVLNSLVYDKNVDGTYTNKKDDTAYMKNLINNGIDLKIVGIIRPSDDAVAKSITGNVGYLHSLVELIINENNNTQIIKEQKNDPTVDVITGKKFVNDDIIFNEFRNYLLTLPMDLSNQVQVMIDAWSKEYGEEKAKEMIIEYYKDTEDYLSKFNDSTTYEDNMRKLSAVDLDSPSIINIYPIDFSSKDKIINFIKDYNNLQEENNNKENVIQYTDYIGLILSSVSSVIDAVTYVLIAFVAISLIVSSIMIGVITYISVLERIKEIGILRAVGASKKDISRVFNAETMIIGFFSGLLGIIVTLLLLIPINLIIDSLAGIGHIAKLPYVGGLLLVIISTVLTLIAGLIPSRIAAKKDPVEALRSE